MNQRTSVARRSAETPDKFLLGETAGERKWFVVDAADLVLGRLAVQVATILMGKHKPTYTPHVDVGDFVVVVNADKVKLTGRKLQDKIYDHYTYYPGGYRTEKMSTLFARKPELIFELAVRRMLPKNRIAREMLNKLKIYRGPNHPHQAQNPAPLTVKIK